MDNYIRYLLPDQVYSIIELFDPIYIILTFIIIFLINIYLKLFIINNNLCEVEKIFHKKCKNIKLMIDSDHTLLYRLNDDILNIENKINETNSKFINNIVERNNRKIYSYINSIESNVDNIFTGLNDTRNELAQIINDIKLIKKNLEKQFEDINIIIEDHRKELLDNCQLVKDEIYSNMEQDNKKDLFNLQLVNSFIEETKKELLDKIDIVDTKVEEVYSELDSLK
jgi:hypothetical protein